MTSENSGALLYVNFPNDVGACISVYEIKQTDQSVQIDQLHTFNVPANFSSMAVSNDGKFLYAVDGEGTENRIFSWVLQDESKRLTTPRFLDSWPSNTSGARHVTVNGNNRFVYVASKSGSVVAFKVVDRRGGLIRCNQFKFSNEETRSCLNYVLLPPNEENVYVTDSVNDCVWKMPYSRLAGFEFITEPPTPFPAPPGSAPTRGVFVKAGDGTVHVYVGTGNGHLLVYYVDEVEFGALELVHDLPVLPEGMGDAGVTDIHVWNSRFIYACTGKGISVFEIGDDGNVKLTQWLEIDNLGLSAMISVGGKKTIVAVGGEKTKDLLAYEAGGMNGELRIVEFNAGKGLSWSEQPSSMCALSG